MNKWHFYLHYLERNKNILSNFNQKHFFCIFFYDFLLDFGTVPTVWNFCFSIRFWNFSDCVVFFVFLFIP